MCWRSIIQCNGTHFCWSPFTCSCTFYKHYECNYITLTYTTQCSFTNSSTRIFIVRSSGFTVHIHKPTPSETTFICLISQYTLNSIYRFSYHKNYLEAGKEELALRLLRAAWFVVQNPVETSDFIKSYNHKYIYVFTSIVCHFYSILDEIKFYKHILRDVKNT